MGKIGFLVGCGGGWREREREREKRRGTQEERVTERRERNKRRVKDVQRPSCI